VLALPVPIFLEALSAPFLNSYTLCLAMQPRHTTEYDSDLHDEVSALWKHSN
jgi:hypothetical protein